MTVKKILIFHGGGIGDMIMAIPAIEGLKSRFSQAEIEVLTISRSAEVLRGFLPSENIHLLSSEWVAKARGLKKIWNFLEDIKLLLVLRAKQFSTAIDLMGVESKIASIKRAALFYILNVRDRYGRKSLGFSFYLTAAVSEDLCGDMHEVERMLAVVRLLGVKVQKPRLRIKIDSNDRKIAEDFFSIHMLLEKRNVIAISPGCVKQTRQWGIKNFIRTGQILQKIYRVPVLVIGGSNDVSLVDQICAGIENSIEVIGFPLHHLAAIFERCTLLISNDSGPMHVAASVGLRTVAIFGPENPNRYRPYGLGNRSIVIHNKVKCSPCVKYECRSMRCLNSVSVDDVVEAVRRLMT